MTKVLSLGTCDEKEAVRKAEAEIAPLELSDDVARRQAMADSIKNAEERAKEAAVRAESDRNRLRLVDAWAKFPYDRTSPRRGTVRRLSPRNIEENQGAWQKFVNWMKAHHQEAEFLETVSTAMAEEYSQHLLANEHLTAGRHNKLITIAGVMFRLAGRPNPFTTVKKQEVHHESRNNLERDQLEKVCQSATGELRRLFAVALYTGMRLGDCVLLRWDHIRLGRIVRVMAKTRREIAFPVHPVLDGVLKEVPKDARSGYICPALATRHETDRTYISRLVSQHFKKCGITTKEEGAARRRQISRYGFHSFRHSFITECARAGVPLGMIREWVGHASTEITKIYEHWQPTEGQSRIVSALPVLSGFYADGASVDAACTLAGLRSQLRGLVETAPEDVLRQMLTIAERPSKPVIK